MSYLRTLSDAILERIQVRSRFLLQHKSLMLALPEATPLFNRLSRVKERGVLLISLPRGGSSWIGSIIGSASDALYLREPITQKYMNEFAPCVSFFEKSKCKDLDLYGTWAHRAFNGIPKFNHTIVTYPEQWGIASRKNKRVVIKEVNPLVLDWMLETYDPYVVYLIRHPASVAASFESLGWGSEQFSQRFSESRIAELHARFRIDQGSDFWSQSGAIQAVTQNLVMDRLRNYDKGLVISFEEICSDPMHHFKRLMEFCRLTWDDKVESLVHQTTGGGMEAYEPGKYDLKRDSSKMPDKWKEIVSAENLEKLKSAYFANHPVYYNEEADWQT